MRNIAQNIFQIKQNPYQFLYLFLRITKTWALFGYNFRQFLTLGTLGEIIKLCYNKAWSKKMKEIDRIKQEYFINKNFRYGAFCCPKSSRKILDFMFNSIPFEKPDFYYFDNQKCYLFEHFEFDASKRVKNCGSLSRRNLNVTNKEIDNEWKSITSNVTKRDEITNWETITKTVENHASKESWKENFCNTFDEHYNKLNVYQDNLKTVLGQDVKFINCFVIEDTTELGGLYFLNGKHHHTLVCIFDFAIKKMNEAKKIDYFIYLNRQDCFCMIISRNGLKKIVVNQLDFNKTNMVFFNQSHVISACISIPDELMHKQPTSLTE